MMPSLVPPSKIGWLSGLGWATGYLGGLVSLAISLLFLSTNPKTGLTLIGTPPILGSTPPRARAIALSGR